jgi:nitrite reductase (NAD(P)H)
LAVFKIKGKFYATQQMCPEWPFVLSDGLIGDDDRGKDWISCPYHKNNFDLNGEQAGCCFSDEKLSITTFPAKEREDGWVCLKLPTVEELDFVLGTNKWKVRKEEPLNPSERVEKKYKNMRGKKVGESGVVVPKRTIVSNGSIGD